MARITSISGIRVDIAFGGLPFEQSAVENASHLESGGIAVRLPRVADLPVMKAVACRPEDLADVRGLLDARRWIREFATAAGMPALDVDPVAVFDAGGTPDP